MFLVIICNIECTVNFVLQTSGIILYVYGIKIGNSFIIAVVCPYFIVVVGIVSICLCTDLDNSFHIRPPAKAHVQLRTYITAVDEGGEARHHHFQCRISSIPSKRDMIFHTHLFFRIYFCWNLLQTTVHKILL